MNNSFDQRLITEVRVLSKVRVAQSEPDIKSCEVHFDQKLSSIVTEQRFITEPKSNPSVPVSKTRHLVANAALSKCPFGQLLGPNARNQYCFDFRVGDLKRIGFSPIIYHFNVRLAHSTHLFCVTKQIKTHLEIIKPKKNRVKCKRENWNWNLESSCAICLQLKLKIKLQLSNISLVNTKKIVPSQWLKLMTISLASGLWRYNIIFDLLIHLQEPEHEYLTELEVASNHQVFTWTQTQKGKPKRPTKA